MVPVRSRTGNRSESAAMTTPESNHRLRPPLPGHMPVYAPLDNVRSVWNVGSMFRTADAVALAGLYLTGMTATPPRPDMEKTALGATRSVPWDYWREPEAACRSLARAGVRLVALEQTEGARTWGSMSWSFPVCFVVGHEVDGVGPGVLALMDDVVEIPMAGVKKSLNVAVSFGVLAYEVRRHWLLQKGS